MSLPPLWKQFDYYIQRRDGATVCKTRQTWTVHHARNIGGDVAIGQAVWLYRASLPDKSWAGPPRLSADEAKADLPGYDA